MMLWIKTRCEKPGPYLEFAAKRQEIPGIGGRIGRRATRMMRARKTGPLGRHLGKTQFSIAPTVFYFGCHAHSGSNAPDALLEIAEAIGEPFEVLAGRSHCCGYRHFLAGDIDAYETHRKRLANTIREISPRQVVTLCVECLHSLERIRHDSKDFSFHSKSAGQWLFDCLPLLTLGKKEGSVAIFEPCLAEDAGDCTQAMIKVLSRIHTCEPIPFQKPGNLCCAAHCHNTDRTVCAAMQKRALVHAAATESGTAVLDCITCIDELGDTAKKMNLQICHGVELVHRRLFKQER